MESSDNFAASGTAEGRYRLLVESISDYAIYMLDPDGRVVNWNLCQSASDKDPLSASNRDPSFGFELVRRSRAGQGCGAVADQRAWFG